MDGNGDGKNYGKLKKLLSVNDKINNWIFQLELIVIFT